ncbi:MAG TPA: sugar transferase [Candidatus Acidoferrales bacterium]|nr:sugar transferase [Candidatus Acidoferrales bacterium]
MPGPGSSFKPAALSVCERLASVALLLAVGPFVAGAGLVLSLLSGRSPLIAHRRVGWQGATLWMLKLRTMWEGRATGGPRSGWFASSWIEYVDDPSGPERKHPADRRVTSHFARFCRRHSIDELPQLWHVLRGQMSLVGPRPVTQSELDRYYGAVAWEILQVKPGLAGLWQVSGRNRLTYAERRDLDLQLVRGHSAKLYLQILLRTVPEIWRGSGSW